MKLLGTGTFLPPRVVKNKELEAMLDTSDEWIQQRSGIEERRWVDSKTSTSDLALAASEKALRAAGLAPQDIDMIVLATLSPDHEFPATSCFLQKKLGLANIPAFDVRQACSGFMYGLSMAKQYLQTGAAKKILLVGAEVHSKCLDLTPRGREVSVLFGDGSGAVVLGASSPQDHANSTARQLEFIDIEIGADGSFARELWVPAPGTGFDTSLRLTQAMLDEGLYFPAMNGRTVFTHAVQKMSELLRRIAERNQLQVDQIDRFILHQANRRICDAIAGQLNLPTDRFFNTIQKYGNTSAASIPIGLHDAIDCGELKPGMTAAFAVFGAGFCYGSALARW